MAKKYCIFFLDMVAIIGGFYLSMLILVSLNLKKEKLNIEFKNWQKSPISDIIVNDSECLGGYEPLINSNYSGILTYCDCTNSTNKEYKGKIFLDICEKEQGIANCRIVPGEEEKEIKKWRGKFICVKRLNTDYHNHIYKINEINKCMDDQDTYVDTEKNKICGDLYYGAINYIEINYTNSTKPDGVEKIKLDDNYSLFYSKNYLHGNLIVDVKLTSNDGICVSSDEGIFSYNNKYISRHKGNPTCNITIKDNKYDNRYKLMDENVNFIETLNDNNIKKYDYILNISKSHTLKLYTIPYIGIKKDCYQDIDLLELFSEGIIFNQICCFVNFIISGIITFYFIICFISCHLSNSSDSFIRILSLLNCFIYIICEYFLYRKTFSYSIFHSFDCIDEISYYHYWEMYSDIWMSKKYIGANIVIYTFLFFNPLLPYEAKESFI